jgi:hypothetical protein
VAEHRITVHPSQPFEVVNADLVVEVYGDDSKIGEVRISRGTVDWRPRSHRRVWSMTWEEFDAVMQTTGRRL